MHATSWLMALLNLVSAGVEPRKPLGKLMMLSQSL